MSNIQPDLAATYDNYVEHNIEIGREKKEIQSRKYAQVNAVDQKSARARAAFHHLPKY